MCNKGSISENICYISRSISWPVHFFVFLSSFVWSNLGIFEFVYHFRPIFDKSSAWSEETSNFVEANWILEQRKHFGNFSLFVCLAEIKKLTADNFKNNIHLWSTFWHEEQI